MTKYIVVAGGVISGVGKGVTTSSIGKILQSYGYKTTAVKIDPYINCDAGTLRPTEHGEVWVTDDGGEIDQDLGNYERFLDINIPKKNNITTGQIYKTIIDRERGGKYLGKTVQFIPHVPDEIKRRVRLAAKGFDICLVEIGGTIGDFENIPFLFAMKSLERDIGKENIIYVLITYLPIPSHIEEMKTKPTQQAIGMLGENGIFPDFIICRAKKPLDSVRKSKIETYANIKSSNVISEPDIDSTIYRIPLDLEREKFGLKILKELKLRPKRRIDFRNWKRLVDNMTNPRRVLKVAMIGKYVDIGDYKLADSYISINESLKHVSAELKAGIKIDWLDAKKFERSNMGILKQYDGIIIPGGFGSTGIEGKINVIRFARLNNIPFLGLCLGMQLAVVEFARDVCKLKDANSTEFNPETRHPVIDILPEQKEIIKNSRYGASMRLGAYPAKLQKGSLVWKLYGEKNLIHERHRHRYEVNPDFIDIIESKGLVFSGVSPDRKLMEFVELPGHKFFVATQAHPEFKSRFGKAAPLFYGFVRGILN
ncbi:MAG: CTP synthase (glutamine hydrolyzing) [Nanoarchaeota archaeon]|nr:CTP synthase (glutamine hydrolyzing) [Nanoarchaeota archaeon]